MESRTLVALLLTVLAARLPHCVAAEERIEAYEIAAPAAVPVLPGPLRVFFEPQLEALRHASVAERCRQSGADGCDGRHYLMLDAGARGADQAARHEAARAFPRKRRQAERLFQRFEIDTGGSLPWTIAAAYHQLVIAFRGRDAAAIVTAAGKLCHYACDAALPFQVGRTGAGAGGIRGTAAPGIDGAPTPGDLRDRLQSTLIARLRDRLAYEVRVAPARYRETTAPVDAAFATMIAAHAALATLIEADAEIGRAPPGDASATGPDVYYDLLEKRTADVIETRLEAAALLSANLIGGAWSAAGRPSLAFGAESAAAVSGDAAAKTYVGSRGSTVFHRSDCRHAQRIKPSNRIRFPSAAAATQAGRSPCKTCKPGVR